MASFNYLKRPGAPKILVVLHQETSTPGRIGIFLQDMGYDLVACRPPLGDPLPETLDDFAGSIIFGGPMSANDNEEFVTRETDWIGVPLLEEKPFLGVCLGAQMLSKHLGGQVMANEREFTEIGFYPLRATEQGKAMMEWPEMVYQWHREGFTAPSGCAVLASSDEYPNQAIRYGKNAYGIQFHCELTLWMMNRWTTLGAHRFCLHGAQPRHQHLEGRLLYDAAIREWLKRFLVHWIGPADRQD